MQYAMLEVFVSGVMTSATYKCKLCVYKVQNTQTKDVFRSHNSSTCNNYANPQHIAVNVEKPLNIKKKKAIYLILETTSDQQLSFSKSIINRFHI